MIRRFRTAALWYSSDWRLVLGNKRWGYRVVWMDVKWIATGK